MEMTLTTIVCGDYGIAGFGPAVDAETTFGKEISHPDSSMRIAGPKDRVGCIFMDVGGGDSPSRLSVHLLVPDTELNSYDEGNTRDYHMDGDSGLVTMWELLCGFHDRLSRCGSFANMDRVLVRELGFERDTGL